MEREERLLLLDDQPGSTEGHLAGGLQRARVLKALADAGARVEHDSGGRLLVVAASAEADEALGSALEGVTVLPLDEDVTERVGVLDPQDALFARALALRMSPAYRDLKRRQKPGSTPEEKLLVSGPCTPPED